MAIKRLMRYLKGTKYYGLYYKRSDRFELKVFIDLDWARNIDDRESTSGGAVFLGKGLCHGQVRNQILSPNQQPKTSMW